LFSLSLLNYSLGAGFKLNKTKNLFLAARLIKGDIANQHLKEVCGDPEQLPYGELCAYIDQFDKWPTTGHYLFDTSSPLFLGDCNHKKKWYHCWEEKDEAYGALVSDILSQPKYFKRYLLLSLSGTIDQLFDFSQMHFGKSGLDQVIYRSYRHDWDYFQASEQNRIGIAYNLQNLIERWAVAISLMILLLFVWLKRPLLDLRFTHLIIIIFSALLANAFICSALSNVVNRYQGRLIFLIPLLALMMIELQRQNANKNAEKETDR
jgi:hypothetical protein